MCLGIPGRIVEIRDAATRAVADVEGVQREVNISLVAGDEGGVAVGDWVLIHVGFAMSVIDQEEAERSLSLLREFDALFDDEVDQFAQTDPEVA